MHQYYDNEETTCSICTCGFDPNLEGGVKGTIGILPMAFCPMCFSGLDMLFTELHGCEDEDDEQN